MKKNFYKIYFRFYAISNNFLKSLLLVILIQNSRFSIYNLYKNWFKKSDFKHINESNDLADFRDGDIFKKLLESDGQLIKDN